MDGKVVVTTSAHQGHAGSGDYFICAEKLREKKCAGARCFLGPLSDILLWFSCFVVCYRLRLKKPAMCIKIFDEHLSIVAVQKCATESEFMTMLKSYIE